MSFNFSTPWRFLPAFCWAAGIWLASSTTWHAETPSLGWWPTWLPADKVLHATVFGVLAALLALPVRHKSSVALGLCWLGAALWGALDEVHQGYVPGRTQDPWDWLADAVGALAAVLLVAHWRQRQVSASGGL